MECPFVDRSFVPNPNFNQPKEFPCGDGTVYVFYWHFDGFDQWYNCQFCKLVGRKRDVFECLNENEWRACSHCRYHEEAVDGRY